LKNIKKNEGTDEGKRERAYLKKKDDMISPPSFPYIIFSFKDNFRPTAWIFLFLPTP